jgi:hypothetical protein
MSAEQYILKASRLNEKYKLHQKRYKTIVCMISQEKPDEDICEYISRVNPHCTSIFQILQSGLVGMLVIVLEFFSDTSEGSVMRYRLSGKSNLLDDRTA